MQYQCGMRKGRTIRMTASVFWYPEKKLDMMWISRYDFGKLWTVLFNGYGFD